MPHISKNQKGFTVIEVLLVLILLSIVGFSGYYVYHAQKSSSKKTTQTAGPTPGDNTKAPVTNQAPAPTDSTQYLVIKEWGVKIPLSADIQDAEYVYDNSNGNDGVGLSTKALAAVAEGCAPGNVGAGRINRETVAVHDQNAEEDNPLDRPVYTIKLGNYYYQYISPQAACSGDNQSVDGLQLQAIQSFRTAVSKIELN